MMVHGQVDGLVTGASETVRARCVPLIQLIKPPPKTTSILSRTMLDLSNKRYGERGE
jgi:phosphotransacetylase